jgi:hypothetical protein
MVTAEYNHSTSGALKNAIDFRYAEWNDRSRSAGRTRRHVGGRRGHRDRCPTWLQTMINKRLVGERLTPDLVCSRGRLVRARDEERRRLLTRSSARSSRSGARTRFAPARAGKPELGRCRAGLPEHHRRAWHRDRPRRTTVVAFASAGGGRRRVPHPLRGVDNVSRHANATRCTVRMRTGDTLHIDVIDDGVGLNVGNAFGVELSSMRERANELGGEFTAEKIAAGGTRVSASLPLPQEGPWRAIYCVSWLSTTIRCSGAASALCWRTSR